MTKIFNWLSAHKIVNVAIAVVYYLLIVLPHEQVGRAIVNLFKTKSRAYYQHTVLLIGVVALCAVLLFLAQKIKNHPYRTRVLIALSATIAMMIVSFNLLLVHNVEIIHFVQYASFCFVVFPLFRNANKTLFWCTLAGAIDDDRELALVGRVHELEFEFVAGPLFSDRAAGNFRVENHRLAASVKGAYIGDLNVIHRSGHDERGLLLVLNGLLDFQGLLITEVTGMLDELLRFGLVRNSEAARRGDEEAAGDDDAVENTELFDDRGPLAVSDAERLERGSDRMEQVHSDDEHTDDVERRPADLGEHHDRGEPHIAHDGAAGDIDVLIVIVFTELEHIKMGDEESDDEETGPDHREGREGLLALARIHFVGFRAAGLAFLELESDREEHVGEEHHEQHRFDAVQEEVRLGEERGVGVVGRLRGCRIRVEQLQVASHVAQDEEREDRARASHNLLPPDGGGQIFDDPLHIGFVSLCAIRR